MMYFMLSTSLIANRLIFGAMARYLIPFLVLIFIDSCKPVGHPPKPPGYFRIDTPDKHEYQVFIDPKFPYSFEYPVYAKIETDSALMGDKPDNPYWMNIVFPSLGGTINITYKEI